MTQEQKRIKLAEAVGIQVKKFQYQIPYHGNTSIWRKGFLSEQDAIISREQNKPWVKSEVEPYNDLFACPDYFNDLNAVHELEKVLNEERWPQYREELRTVVLGEIQFGLEWCKADIHATAAQRAEALGLTLNLW
jgi:hypothetical protein